MTAFLQEQSPDLDRLAQLTAIQAALSASGYRAITRLQCRIVDGSFVLTGAVSSYYLKQLAQEVVLRLRVVERIHNAVEVRR